LDNQRNLLLAVVLCGLLIFGWDAATRYFYPQPVEPVVAARTEAAATPTTPTTATRGGLDSPATVAAAARPTATPVRIDAPRIAG
jgi:YidC/Oxa1 family membrane protein insertase